MSATFAPFPRDALDRSIPDRFAEQVTLYPARIAIGTSEGSVTYGELGQTVERIARAVLSCCGPAGEPVALLFDQGASLVAAALGVLAAGKHYVPLDPAYPRAHLLATLRDLQPRLTLTDHHHRDLASRLVPDCGQILAVDKIDATTLPRAPLPTVAPDALAYIFYTSGSTGRAKGVMDTHRNVLHNIMRYTNSLRITADDRFTLVQPASSSGAVSDVFGALLTGAALFPVNLQHEDLAGLATWINREHLTIYHSAPAIFRHIAQSVAALPSLRVIRLEGDTASPRDVDLFRTRCAADSILVNGLGLTECGLVRQYFVTRSTPVDAPVPVGYAVEDMTVAVIDAAGREVPAGEIGEIVVESRFLALGYWGQPDLTAERFSTVLGRPEVRRYRTGDLGRLRPDGCLLHLGRIDFQPKVRGHRIDTEAIEAALLELFTVSEAAVMVRSDGPDGPRLVAYCVASGTPPPTVSALRRHLTERLPREMLPASYVWLPRLPLTDNGKVDRRVLPAPGRTRPPLDTVMVAPLSTVETALVQLWAEALGLDEVGVDDDFFDLGGDSLQAMHLVGRIRASFGVELGVPTIFASPTVGSVAAIIATEPAAAMGVRQANTANPRVDVSGPFPLSPPQERLLFLCQLDPGEPVYNAPLAMRLSGPLAIDALGEALDAVVARHEALRTTIQLVDGVPLQRVEPIRPVDLTRVDLTAIPDASRTAELQRRLRDEVRRPFDLGRDPMLRAHLFDLAANEHVLLLVVHHIATDGWSEGVFIADLSALYEAARRGEPPQLSALPMRYADYVAWQHARLTGELRASQLDYWRRRLADAPDSIDLPQDGPQRMFGSTAGATESMYLPSALVDALLQTSREVGATLFMTLLAAFKAVLQRHTGRDDIVVGTAIAGRTQPETEGLVGFFVNTLALRTDLSGDPTFRELVARVRETSLGAYAHQDLPFASLVADLNPQRQPGRLPLVQIAFVFEPPLPPFAPASLASERLEIHTGASAFELTLFVEAVPAGLRATAEFRTALYDAPMIVRLLGHWRNVLEAIVANPKQRIGDLPLLNALERHQLLVEWNDTTADYPRDRCIHQLFEEQVKRTPNAVAVEGSGRSVSYRELNARAEQLAERLRANGVRSGSLVAIYLERSIEMVVAVLGVWKTGGAYVPIDPGYPTVRVRFMLEDTQALVVLTQQSLAGTVPEAGAAVLLVDGDAGRAAWDSSRRARRSAMSPEQLAYVIYTSGSTGRPKGVPITHRSLSNLMCWHQRAYEVTPADRATQIAAPAFDASVWETWPYLTAGASVHIPDEATRLDPRRLVRWLIEQRITLTFLPTPIAEAALRESWPPTSALRVLLTGGDKLNKPPAHKLPFRLVNHYGPTENAVVSTCAEVSTQDASHNAPPIGRPLPNTRAYVLDSHLQPVPIGIPGELLLGGAQIATGYWNRPELTAEKFVPDPFSAKVGARLYRTGDLARYLPDGNIEYLGRIDDQVKIRGFRIEPGEIETVLAEHPMVRGAVVIVRESTAGDKRLVAYVVPANPTLTDCEPLRVYLRERLPDYMVPAAYVVLECLPLTPNGKVDRKALPVPDEAACSSRAYEAPVGEIETALAPIWADVLKLDRVGRHDHFFELGGHSLLAVSMIERMRQAGLHADVRALFVTPTLAELAGAVGTGGRVVEVPPNRIPPACDAITPEMLPLVQLTSGEIQRVAGAVPGGAANVQDIYPLAPLQEGVLFHHVMATEGDPYLLSALFGFDSRGRLQRYLQALQAVIDRHDILRTAVLWEGLPEPVQVVWRRAPLAVEEVKLTSAAGDVAQQLRARFNPRRYRLDVRQAPLMRVIIAHDAANTRWLMLQLFHHLSIDHTTLEVVQEEIQAHLLGHASQLPAPLPFRNFVAQTRLGVSTEEHKAFFQKMLGDVDEPTAPFGLTDVRGDGSGIAEAGRLVDASLARRLRERARTLGVSAASVCHVAWAQVLARASEREDVVFGTVLLGRMHGGSGADRVLGLLINTLPVRIRVGDEGVQDSVRHTHALLGQLLRHEHAQLALAQRCSAVAAPTPLFSALLNYRHSAAAANVPADALDTRDGIESLGGEERTNYPLTLAVDDQGEGFALKVQAQSSIDPQRVCAFMHTALERLVSALERAPTTPLRNVDVLPEFERHQLLVEWNDTAVDYPRDQCIQQLFEQQVERSPEAVAVVFGEAQLSYRGLNARANQLAHHLRTLGVGPEVLVGICLERSLDLVIGLLGVLKAGGAYVPLDPSYPAQRLVFMLEDMQAPVLLTQERLLGQLPVHARHTLCLDRDWAMIARQPDTLPPCPATAENLAYVIYTSGSTGTPKGVMIEHRALVNHMEWMCGTFGFGRDDSVLQKTPVSFDAAMWELFAPLLVGGRLVMARPNAHRDPGEIVDLLRRHEITTLQVVPSLLRMLVREPGLAGCPKLRRVFCGGEALQGDLARHFLDRSGARLYNLYGPTEACIDATWWECRHGDAVTTVPIGRPIANATAYVLDMQGQPVPIGVPGELCLGGEGVARGYLGQPELTAERFVPDPFAPDAHARMYRTGDRTRYMQDGNIEFLGRLDTQVKLRGYRIELGEIEAVLARQPQVREAVMLRREDTPGEPRLVAYLVPQGESPTAADLRASLKQSLPDYMLPSAFVFMAALPLTPNGKVDRKSLPAPGSDSLVAEEGFVAPHDAIEVQLARIWEALLGLYPVGVRDDFFDLGGHSLLAVQVIDRVNQLFGRDLPIDVLWHGGRTIETLAAILRARAGEGEPLWSHPVPIRPGGTRRPLFCAPVVGGHLFFYDNLARCLDPEQPVYGLPAQGTDGRQPPHTTIEAMAAHAIRLMREVQPSGPYSLLGYCSGGVVAFEMARQLEMQGESAALLALVDSWAPRFSLEPWGNLLLPADGRRDWRLLQERIYQMMLHPLGLGRLRRFAKPGEAHRWALWSYRPKRVAGRAVLIRPSDSAHSRNPALGWDRFVAGGVEVAVLPGQHGDLVKGPGAAHLAKELTKWLA